MRKKDLSIVEVAEVIRKYVKNDPVFGLQGVDRAASEIVLLTVKTDD